MGWACKHNVNGEDVQAHAFFAEEEVTDEYFIGVNKYILSIIL